MTTKPSHPQAGVLSDEEINEQVRLYYANAQTFLNLARAIEAAVLAKQAQAPTGQSGEVEGLLREALDECRKIATGERQVLDAVDDTDGLRAIEKIASKALAVMK